MARTSQTENGGGSRLVLPTWWPLAAALFAAVAAYARALNSPFYGDDYIYLVAAREMPFGDYAKAAFTPWGNEPLLPFTRDFWRPLAFLWFEVSEPLFGGNTVPYHAANLALHLASVVLIWFVAARLDPRPAVRAVAAVVFALYPGSFEAVTWISSVNSAGLPLALGSWLLFLQATPGASEPGGAAPRWNLVLVSVGLLALAQCFRESSTALLPALGLWYLLVQRRAFLGELRTYLPLVPFAVLGIAYYLLRTRLLTEPFANPDIYAIDSTYREHWWFYMKNALLPFRDPVTSWREPAQDVAGVAIAFVPVVALLRRRWDVLALSLGFIVSTLPYGATLLGVGQRYLYFSTPILAVVLGVLAAEAAQLIDRRQPRYRAVLVPALIGVLIVVGAFATSSRIGNWIDIAPERQQTWVDGLREAHPSLPEGGTLYAANVPLILAVFDGANLGPTVRWYYPEVGEVIYHTGTVPPVLGPDDRFYDADRPGASRAQP